METFAFGLSERVIVYLGGLFDSADSDVGSDVKDFIATVVALRDAIEGTYDHLKFKPIIPHSIDGYNEKELPIEGYNISGTLFKFRLPPVQKGDQEEVYFIDMAQYKGYADFHGHSQNFYEDRLYDTKSTGVYSFEEELSRIPEIEKAASIVLWSHGYY